MEIRIIGTESLGVRGLSCVVKIPGHRIVIDPGIALGYNRHGLLPHPFQVAVGDRIRKEIIKELSIATDVVFSHYHGDHVPLANANPYQLSLKKVIPVLHNPSFWCKGGDGLTRTMKQRYKDLCSAFGKELPDVESSDNGYMSFSALVPHGEANRGTVMMTRIKDKNKVFVHASDIQLFDNKVIDIITAWHPDIVLASGPPVYLFHRFSPMQREAAWRNGLQLARNVKTLILDHHLMRSETGEKWLYELSKETSNSVICAADFMKRPRLLLEAKRRLLYREMPVPDNWHKDYAMRFEEVGQNCNCMFD
ncbi:hypothetical protein CH330_05520 [candidate division WOR-3 bacterium JGI_Cruoil_03_51_56]|uniref:Metallo-beta-lactamase domain-containing protein n=1 Tax=candidate division WOR-3 bacterium JGI_Cruoil_03_51_56 TaxID=1973747 RepID=A0A235BTI5_UNCW3|nr:MAG: hypothetical protein CH330_05520 [candidate division WOR-3 bacterium JGI_Cruoil_03_51_56]